MILNLTQHKATPAQVEAGVVEPSDWSKDQIRQILTFEEIPDRSELLRRAEQLTVIAANYRASRVMVGGASYFMEPLCVTLREWDITPVFAFSRRESVEETLPDGSVRKSQVFQHLGFVEG